MPVCGMAVQKRCRGPAGNWWQPQRDAAGNWWQLACAAAVLTFLPPNQGTPSAQPFAPTLCCLSSMHPLHPCRGSPTSQKLTFEQLRRGAALPDLAACLHMENRMVRGLGYQGAGVAAALPMVG